MVDPSGPSAGRSPPAGLRPSAAAQPPRPGTGSPIPGWGQGIEVGRWRHSHLEPEIHAVANRENSSRRSSPIKCDLLDSATQTMLKAPSGLLRHAVARVFAGVTPSLNNLLI